METFTPKGEEKQLSLITYVEEEPADESDAGALIPAIENTSKRKVGPSEVLADTLYGGDENCEKAKELGVEVVAPTSGTLREGALTLADFTLTDENVITACPEGKCPVQKKQGKNGHIARFALEDCCNCPRLADCPAQEGKRGYYVRYGDKDVRLAKRRAIEKTEEFRERYSARAGVEATMSQCKAKTGLGRLRIRGRTRVRFCAAMKAAAINILRATAFRNREKTEPTQEEGSEIDISAIYIALKAQGASSLGAVTKRLRLSWCVVPRFA